MAGPKPREPWAVGGGPGARAPQDHFESPGVWWAGTGVTGEGDPGTQSRHSEPDFFHRVQEQSNGTHPSRGCAQGPPPRVSPRGRGTQAPQKDVPWASGTIIIRTPRHRSYRGRACDLALNTGPGTVCRDTMCTSRHWPTQQARRHRTQARRPGPRT